MIIRKMSQIMDEIIAIENKAINEFSINISHTPTIGSQYEGATIKALDGAIPDNLNLKVVSGFIVNSKGEKSGQIDCMLCKGDGLQIPGTSGYCYQIQDVIAVIEVKKNLFTADLSESYQHLLEVNDMDYDFNDSTNQRLDIFSNIYSKSSGKIIKKHQDSNYLEGTDYYVFHGLLSQFLRPLRIVIGYQGFVSEESLRNKFVDYLNKNHHTKGFGPFSFPDMIICGEHCLVKCNGEPYQPKIIDNIYNFYLSSSNYNIRILTELIYGRLSRLHNFDFSDDSDCEPLRLYLGAKICEEDNKVGWGYHFFESAKTMEESSWEPIKLSIEESALVHLLCFRDCPLDDDFYKSAINDDPSIIDRLKEKGLIAINEEYITLTTVSLKIAEFNGEIFAGEDNCGYFTQWLEKIKDEQL